MAVILSGATDLTVEALSTQTFERDQQRVCEIPRPESVRGSG